MRTGLRGRVHAGGCTRVDQRGRAEGGGLGVNNIFHHMESYLEAILTCQAESFCGALSAY